MPRSGNEPPAESLSAALPLIHVKGQRLPATKTGRRLSPLYILRQHVASGGSGECHRPQHEQRALAFPKIVGTALAGAMRIADGVRPLATDFEQVGEDILVRARLREW